MSAQCSSKQKPEAADVVRRVTHHEEKVPSILTEPPASPQVGHSSVLGALVSPCRRVNITCIMVGQWCCIWNFPQLPDRYVSET